MTRCDVYLIWQSRVALASPVVWWSQPGSNRRPSGCKPDALPAELWPLPLDLLSPGVVASCQSPKSRRESVANALTAAAHKLVADLVGLGGVEPPTSPLSGVRSNQLSYRPGGQCREPAIGPKRSNQLNIGTGNL